MLEQWFNLLPVNVTVDLYKDILPKLSDFLHIEQQIKKKDKDDASNTYFYNEMMRSNNDIKIDRKDIAYKVLDLLGKVGGHAHNIINND